MCGALRSFAPSYVCWTDVMESADVELVHVDSEAEAQYAVRRAQMDRRGVSPGACPFVAIQHGTRKLTARSVPPAHYVAAWRAALLTTSFQDLSAEAAMHRFRFYPMPWGARRVPFRRVKYTDESSTLMRHQQ